MRRLLTLSCLALAASAQTPLLRVQSLPNPRGVGLDLVVTNSNSVPATAWIASAEYVEVKAKPKDPDVTDSAVYWSNPLALVPDDQSLPPQANRHKNLGRGAASVTRMECLAVIYADGSTAGDPALINVLLTQRRHALGEIAAVQELLKTAAADPSPDLNDLVETLRARAPVFDAALKADASATPEEPNAVHCICGTIANQLHAAAASRNPSAAAIALQTASRQLDSVRQNLLNSSPALQ